MIGTLSAHQGLVTREAVVRNVYRACIAAGAISGENFRNAADIDIAAVIAGALLPKFVNGLGAADAAK
jgi:hypothetical protein